MAKPQPAEFSTASSSTSAPEVRFEQEGKIIRINFRSSDPWKNGGDDKGVPKIQLLAPISKKVILEIDFSQPGTSTSRNKKAIQNRITNMRDAINGDLDGRLKKRNEIMDVQVTVHMYKWSTTAMKCFLPFEKLDSSWYLNFTEGGGASQFCFSSKLENWVDLEKHFQVFGLAKTGVISS